MDPSTRQVFESGMEEEPDQSDNGAHPFDDATGGPSSSSDVREEEGEEGNQFLQVEDHPVRRRRPSGVSFGPNFSLSDAGPGQIREDMWSCLAVLFAFWFFAASMALIYGFLESHNLSLSPNCSRLIQLSSFLVQSIKVQEIAESKHQSMLYGFYETPPLDVEITWSETHHLLVLSNYQKEWEFFLNRGSKLDISYDVKSPSSAPLSFVIAQGKESIAEWMEDPSNPNTTLSWYLLHGSGIIHQEILRSKMYYIAVDNFNLEEIEVQLNFIIMSTQYNTSQAYFKCSLSHHLCSLNLLFLMSNAAVLTSPGLEQKQEAGSSFVKIAYGPRWLTFFSGSGIISALTLLGLRICNMLQITSRPDETGLDGAAQMASERAPLLSGKDDLSSWGSSYDSVSDDEKVVEEWTALVMASLDVEKNNQLCATCFDAPRDCFFLPCGHCAACFACGTRIVEEAGTCPICGRTMKKVRKIFAV